MGIVIIKNQYGRICAKFYYKRYSAAGLAIYNGDFDVWTKYGATLHLTTAHYEMPDMHEWEPTIQYPNA